MIEILYKGKPTNYPLYETIDQAIAAMVANGFDEESLTDTWTSPRGIEPITTFREVDDAF